MKHNGKQEKHKRMGIFHVDIGLSKAGEGAKQAKVKRLMVDSGSELTWIPTGILEEIGIGVRKKDQPFVMANGQTITRDIGYASIRCGDFETVDEVVFAKQGDLSLLGVRTLEGFNARPDFVQKRLVASGPMPVAGNHRAWRRDVQG